MKIGILTYHFANNYGASLQAYAMQATLSEMGADAEFIDYRSVLQTSNNSLFMSVKTKGGVLKNIIRIPHLVSRKKRISKFNSFRSKYLNVTPVTFRSEKEAIEYIDKSNYDAIIVGSDQIWNPKAPDFDSIYFNVSVANVPVYVYAASLGTAKENILTEFSKQMLRFKAISVREEASIPILKKVDSKLSPIGVLDPTLLPKVDFFTKISTKYKGVDGDYVVCYYLGRKDALKFKEAAKLLAKKFGFDIYFINVNYGLTSYGKDIISDCGTEEFLGLLQNAKFVCTNSFHAVAISLRFGVPFFSFENSGLKDTRKSDLLRRLDIMERIIVDFDISNINSYEMNGIDIEEKLRAYRDESLKFLKNIVEE